MKKIKNKKFKFVDLFAGCGGLSLGLEIANFEPIFVNELNSDALETYLINRDVAYPLLRSKYSIRDIKELIADDGALLDKLIDGFKQDYKIDIKREELDLLVGGPPCQGFSGMGHRRSYSVNKKQLPSNHLYQDMAYVISRLRPKIFLFENVRGLITARWSEKGVKGEIWKDVQAAFSSIPNYQVHPELIYAKNYGIPQNRPRVLIVGIRSDINFTIDKTKFADGFLPEPSNDYINLEDLLGDLVDDHYLNGGITAKYPKRAATEPQKLFRFNPRSKKISPKNSSVSEHKYSNHGIKIRNKFIYMHSHSGKILNNMKTKKFSQRLLPAKWGKNGPTITITSMPDDYVHYLQPRTLTVREWARLQTFPDWYEFSGSRTTGGINRAGNPRMGLFERSVPKYTQIGNAVPVVLGTRIGEHFRSILLASNSKK